MEMLKEFKIDIPVEVRKVSESEGIVTLLPNRKRAIIEYSHEGDLFDMIATLRLGLDYSPLLTTFYFQKDCTEEEMKFFREFYLLSLPVVKTWAFKNAFRYVEEKRVKKEAKAIADYVNIAYMWSSPEDLEKQAIKQVHHVVAYLLLKYVVEEEIDLELEGDYKEEWERYIELVEELVKEKPSPYLLAKIPERIEAPYRVKVKKIPFLHYEVKGRW